jgi:hypothetical protein
LQLRKAGPYHDTHDLSLRAAEAFMTIMIYRCALREALMILMICHCAWHEAIMTYLAVVSDVTI